MTASTPGRWLRAMNPLAQPRDRSEAERSARAFAVGSAVALLGGIPSTIWLFQSGWMMTLMDQQYAAMGLSAAEIAVQKAFMEVVWPYAIAVGQIITLMIYGAFAFVQWRYMTRALPLIVLAFSTYTLVSAVGFRLMGMTGDGPQFPLWVTAATWATFAVQTTIYVASLQGAIMLHGLRQGAR